MSETEVNIPLLRKAVEWAEAEAAKPPELREWEQNYYVVKPGMVDEVEKAPACGTCYCIAGYIAASTATLMPDSEHDDDGRHVTVIAAEALGVDRGALSGLFHYDNDIADVRRIAESIAGERL